MYIRRFSIYTINAYPYIYIHIWDHSSHISMHICLWQWSCSHSNISIIYSYICGFSFHQVNIFILMSYITIMLPKLPLRKCPQHSKFLGSLQSSHLFSWNCRPTQYFVQHKITWSNQGWGFLSWGTIVHPLKEINFHDAQCNSISNPNLTETEFQAMVHCSVNEIFYWLKNSYVSVVNQHWTLVITK